MGAVGVSTARHTPVRRTFDCCNDAKARCSRRGSETGLTVCQKAGKPDTHARHHCSSLGSQDDKLGIIFQTNCAKRLNVN